LASGEPNRTEPNRTEPNRTEPNRTEPKRTALTLALLIWSGLVLCSPRLRAQTNDRIFHVYVDPIQGDDAVAAARNPSVSGSDLPLQTHQGDPVVILGELQHAPYSFRTVTAAVAWINAPSTFGTPALPFTHPQSGARIRHLVIHCLPGLYGPRTPGLPAGSDEFDPESGLPWNGESFPIVVPPRVGIQGTSALDTIFDARDYESTPLTSDAIFVFDSGNPATPPVVTTGEWDNSFIDSVSMRGCRFDGSADSGAALRIEGFIVTGGPLFQPSISNCFIYCNDVGIKLASLAGTTGQDLLNTLHPRIVANTIAWNHIGIYSGWITGGTLQTGTARPLILDNLIDPMIRKSDLEDFMTGIGAGGTPPSCFEGLDFSDLFVNTVDVKGGSCQLSGNFNGYHNGLRNQGVAWPYGATTSRTVFAPPLPVVDLAPLLGAFPYSDRTALLFVLDLSLLRSPLRVSQHDFRLAPMVRSNPAAPLLANPVINQGISSRNIPIQGANSSSLISNFDPGMPPDDLASFTAWDWDCEGVGNPRQASRTDPCSPQSHFPEPFACAGKVDLGADELGELIAVGFLTSTRTYTIPHPAVAANTAALQGSPALMFLLNFACDPNAATTYVAPQFNFRADLAPITPPGSFGSPPWFDQLGPFKNPFTVQPMMPVAFTEGKHQAGAGPVTVRAALTNTLVTGFPPTATPYPAFMRSRVVDVGAHLAEDIFADPNLNLRDVDYAERAFLAWPGAPTGLIKDAFQSNPWFQARPNDVNIQTNENAFLYGDRTSSATKRLRSGTSVPPLVMIEDPLQATFPKSYLFRNSTHPLNYLYHPLFQYSVEQVAEGLTTTDVLQITDFYFAGMDYYGIRMNLELFDPDNPLWEELGGIENNLQTFLVVGGDPGVSGRSSSQFPIPSGRTPQFPATEPERESAREAMNAILRDRVRRER
jgi:hypothetical protein